MLSDTHEPPTVQETYAGAISTGSSRPGAFSTKAADYIPSAGMSPYRMGTALMRLVSEWHSGAVPKGEWQQIPAIRELAKAFALERVNSMIRRQEAEGERLKVSEKQRMRAEEKVRSTDMDMARSRYQDLQARAADWTQHENMLRFQGLKTLGTVRAGMLHWVQRKGWEDAEGIVAQVLQRFLSPKCPKCGGCGLIVIDGTGGRSAGKRCKAQGCRDSAVAGELVVPHGGRGRALLQYMTQCMGQAGSDMREGVHRLHRRSESEEARDNRKQRERSEELQRADAEAQADAKQDTAAVAAHFRDSLTVVKRTRRG